MFHSLPPLLIIVLFSSSLSLSPSMSYSSPDRNLASHFLDNNHIVSALCTISHVMDNESYFMLSKLFYLFLSLVIARAVHSAVQFFKALRAEFRKETYSQSDRGEWINGDGLILLPSTVVFTNVRVNSTFRYSELLTPVSDPQYFFSEQR